MSKILKRSEKERKLTDYFPVMQMLVFAAALFLVQAVFSVCAVRYSRRLSLVERIQVMD